MSAFAGTLAVPTVRHYGYINGTLNLSLVASAEVQAAGATVEVQSSVDEGETWTALAGSGSVKTTFSAYTIDNGGNSTTLTDYHWKSAAHLASDILLRYRLVNGTENSDWSASLAIVRSVAAQPKSVTASTGSDTISLASDGDLSTSFSGTTPTSIVYDFGKSVEIGEIRLAAMLGQVCRLRTTKIKCANTSDFSDAQTLVEFTTYQDACSKMGISLNQYYNVVFSGIPVASFTFDNAVSARYFRIGRPAGEGWNADLNGNKKYDDRDDGGTFNFSEIEFSLADPTAVTFESFAVGLDATTPIPYTNRNAVVSWEVGFPYASSFTVERGTSAEGPFFDISSQLASDTTAWTDTTALVGVTYYYRVKALSVDAEPRAFYSSIVSHTRDRRLERDPSDLTKLRSGVTLIADNSTTFWRGPVAYAFDGKTSTMPCTYSDDSKTTAWNNWQNPYVGVNLGENCRITGCLVISAIASDWWANYFARINTVNLYGTANSAGYYNMGVSVDCRWPTDPNGSAGRTELAQIRNCVRSQWRYFQVTEASLYRSVYLQNPNPNDNTAGIWADCTWMGNVSEFGIFGYSDAERTANYAALVTAPTTFTAVKGGAGIETAWNEGHNAAGYRVQRRPFASGSSGDSGWENVSANLAADVRAFTDTPSVSGAYQYRVVAIDSTGTDAGYSVLAGVYFYPSADGTGLRASLVWPFVQDGYDANEAVRSSSVAAPSVQFAAGTPRVDGEPGSTNGVRVVFEGTLVVPVAGDYQFRAVGTDGAALRLDGHFVLNAWNASAASRATVSAAITLTAGEHAFRFDTWQGTGDRAVALEWSIAETGFAPVPVSQLRPAASAYTGTVAVPLKNGSVETWNVRTFGQKELGLATIAADPKDAQKQALVIGGYDNAGVSSGLGQTAVFKKMKGSFEIYAKIDLPGSPDNPGTKGIASADADTIFFLTARTGFGAGSIGYGPYTEWYGYRSDARLGVGVLYKTATDWGPDANGTSTSWWNFKPSNLATDSTTDTWLRLRLVRDFDDDGKTVFTSYYRKGSSGDWTLFSKWTDTEGVFGPDAYICLGATRKPHASLSADTTRFLVREIKCKSTHQGLVILFR